MNITNIEWDEDSVFHIARHHVNPEEVEEVCFSNASFLEKGREKFYYVTGPTESGRYLFIVVKFIGHGKVKVITARDMDSKEKSRYKNKRR